MFFMNLPFNFCYCVLGRDPARVGGPREPRGRSVALHVDEGGAHGERWRVAVPGDGAGGEPGGRGRRCERRRRGYARARVPCEPLDQEPLQSIAAARYRQESQGRDENVGRAQALLPSAFFPHRLNYYFRPNFINLSINFVVVILVKYY